ncbi:MAG TPA: pyruvate, phosphate dikinase [Nitrospinota bacterium]|nr:pyruvate, phosphate dikinase [Nitrospinota bacterium]
MRNLLGGKGADLAEMASLDVPVPPGFTITTEACIEYYNNNKSYPEGLWDEVEKNLEKLEEKMRLKLGDDKSPLLVSVRSGARVSMPGMMDTVLNLGLNDRSVKGLVAKSGNERFAYDSYRRFITMFGDVVLGIEHKKFEYILNKKKKKLNVKLDTELNAKALQELVSEYKRLVEKEKNINFPEDPKEQLKMAIDAVFDSWNNQRAITYRRLNKIPGDWGTAVNIQTMVFGNMGDNSGTGVAFTRDPATGEKRFFGEYLINAQGEDVVAGIRTPQPIETLKEKMPSIYKELEDIYKKLEQHFRDMQDIEFTIQDGKLYMLQTRRGKRTALSSVKIAVDMVNEGLIDKKEAVLRVDPYQLDQLLHPMFDSKAKVTPIAKGLPGSSGAAVGKVVFTADRAEELHAEGEDVILVRNETSPEDVGGMYASKGILTARGGLTSHAAVVGRGMGKCCVVGCGAISVDEEKRYFKVDDKIVKEKDYISLNGNTGEVILGKVDLVESELSDDFETLMKWADEIRTLGVRANADTSQDAEKAVQFGTEGIGLTRTEHMFFKEDRIPIVREMIMAKDKETRDKALEKLLPMQREDFIGIFKVMKGMPVTIRLLDPPLHEFLPKHDELFEELTELKLKGGDKERISELEEVLSRVDALAEFNPMLGHRGCRLGITFPEVYDMQVRAIFEAAVEIAKKGGKVFPEVMIPLTGTIGEMRITYENAKEVIKEVLKNSDVEFHYMIGTMIEVPRAALVADKIAEYAEFFSFGTNDMTQMTFGFSRDDAGKFLPFYIDKGILKIDPFVAIDQEGVGEMVRIGAERGKKTRPDIELGICGEHGGEPSSVEFFHRIGLDYVSCSPYLIPVARLAAAHAKLKEEK